MTTARRFQLVRYVDVSGVSGTGAVAEGIQFSDGTVTLRWYGEWPTTSTWQGMDDLVAVHGHNGASVIRWVDPEAQRGTSARKADLCESSGSGGCGHDGGS
jgi:hypothetical protein